MTAQFKGMTAVVTGAARGQGRAIALMLAEAGANVAICDVGTSQMATVGYELAASGALEEVAAEIRATGGAALAQACDVRRQEDVDAFFDVVTQAFGRVDILVNNAGILTGNKPAHELSDQDWSTMLDVNLTGVFRMSRAAAPIMIKGAAGGRIINIASVAGLIGTPGFAHYCAAKHGVVGLTKAMAAELAQYSITVNAICPGLVDTQMVEHSTSVIAQQQGVTQEEVYDQYLAVHLIKERITPEQSAAAVLYLASDAARVVTGSAMALDAGWSVT